MTSPSQGAVDRARDNAIAAMTSISTMIKRLRHVRECKGKDCNLTDQEVYAGINLLWNDGMVVDEEERAQYHNEDSARQAIEEDPLSVQVRSGWYTPGETPEAMEYEILLGTGGPALRIVGNLGQRNVPETAHLEYQDWFFPWKELVKVEHEDLLEYAQVFYYG